MKNKLLMLLLSLSISFGLWLYVVTVISPESEQVFYDIPVELVGNDYLNSKDLMVISSTTNLRVDLTLRGNRSDLKKLSSSNITVIADLSKITKPGEHRLDCSVSFQAGTAEVVSQNPDQIKVVVAEKLTKTVPVKVSYVGTVASGYEEDRQSVSMDHTTVTISGPKETVDKIAYASITVDLADQLATFVGDYPMVLCGYDTRPVTDVSYVSTNVSAIRTVVQINKVKKVAVRFNLDFSNSGLSQEMATIYPSLDTVTLVGSSEALEKVDDVLVFDVHLGNYSSACTETFIPNLPDGVQCREDIQVYIQIPDMIGRWVTVNQFEFMNVPDGMDIEVTSFPSVEIWGPREVLEVLTAEQVLAIIDCSSAGTAQTYVPVTYVVPGYEYLYVRVDWSNGYISVRGVVK